MKHNLEITICIKLVEEGIFLLTVSITKIWLMDRSYHLLLINLRRWINKIICKTYRKCYISKID